MVRLKYIILTLLLTTASWSQSEITSATPIDSTTYNWHLNWPAREFVGTQLQMDITYDLIRGYTVVYHSPFCPPYKISVGCYFGDGFYQSLNTKWQQGYAIGLDEVKSSDKVKYILLGVAIGAGTYYMISELGAVR